MTYRNPALVVVFTILTCGIYGLYWAWVTDNELNRETGSDYVPVVDVLLAFVTGGIWLWYVHYRNAEQVHRTLLARGIPHDDRSTLIIICDVLSLVIGVGVFIGMALLQDDLNKLVNSQPAVTRVA